MTDFDDILGAEIDTRSEKAIQNDMMVKLTAIPESLLFRNNTGQAWQGKKLRLGVGQMFKFEQGMVVLRAARPVKFGLEGSGDIMGSVQGCPVAVEAKDADGHQGTAQIHFERAWVKAGGIYILARSAAEAERKVNEEVQKRRKLGIYAKTC